MNNMDMGDPYDLSSGLKGFKLLAASAAKKRERRRALVRGTPTGPTGSKGITGSVGPGPCPTGLTNSQEQVDAIAHKIMHDPDFDPLFLIQKLLADYIAKYSGGQKLVPENELDELIEKYLK